MEKPLTDAVKHIIESFSKHADTTLHTTELELEPTDMTKGSSKVRYVHHFSGCSKYTIKRDGHSSRIPCDKSAVSLLERGEKRDIKVILLHKTVAHGSSLNQTSPKFNAFIPPYLADRTEGEAEGDAGSHPALLQHHASAVKVEDVATLQVDGGGGGQGLREADHAHVVSVLLQGPLVRGATPMETGQARVLIQDPTARVTALQDLGAGLLCQCLG